MKKFVSIILAIVMLFSVTIPAYATSNSTSFVSASEEEHTYCADNYTQYTIDFTQTRSGEFSYASDANTVDTAIAFVESLELKDMGYAHIEEACLNELNTYKENDIVLEEYTVLVPKTREMYFYGTYLGYDYYYEYTSVSKFDHLTEGATKGAKEEQWNDWVLGLMTLILGFAVPTEWSVPYSVVSSVTGLYDVSSIHYGDYNVYTEDYTDVYTRTIYKQRSANILDPCYQDQSCWLVVEMYYRTIHSGIGNRFIPVNTLYRGYYRANHLTQEQILHAANVHSNHDSMVIYSVSSNRVRENWGD